MSQQSDSRTLFVRCDTASVKQIEEVFKSLVNKYNTEFQPETRATFYVNRVENRQGESLGMAFVYITDSKLFHLIQGKNPDGSDRIEYRPDPNWVKSEIAPLSEDASWADMVEYEEAEHCPMIPIVLEPLLTVPPYKLTPEQIAEKRARIISLNKDKPGFDEKMVDVPDHAFLIVSPAFLSPIDEKFSPNILKAKNVPSWVTPADIKLKFTPFTSNSKTVVDRVVKGRHFKETYPFVNINSEGIAFVIFDPATLDAPFALYMLKKCVMTKKSPDGRAQSCTLIFNHSFSTDRDKMAEIVQKPVVVKQQAPLPKPKLNKFAGLIVDE